MDGPTRTTVVSVSNLIGIYNDAGEGQGQPRQKGPKSDIHIVARVKSNSQSRGGN